MAMTFIRRVAVLGAGTMGARIAAHFANSGVEVLLLDVATPDQPDRSIAAKKGLEAALKGRPGAFFLPSMSSLIQTGNFEDDLPSLANCDWIIEAVAENLEIKRSLLAKVARHRKPGTILTTNTSGIPLSAISASFEAELRQHFFGTHFFNPPRYLHLVEVIPGADTRPDLVTFVTDYCDRRLGKGVVPCKDTPNFIANRIGSFFGSTVQMLTVEQHLTLEEVDFLTGPLIGLPKSASYRLLDIVGLDVWAHVTNNLSEAVPHDPWRPRFVMQPFLQQMLDRKWLGDKTGQGCYKRVGKDKEIHALDWKTMEYRPVVKPLFPEIETARQIEDLPARLRALVAAGGRAGNFLWQILSDLLIYSAGMVPEISDRIVEIDRAMRWGYANTLGPFELWDALGFVDTVRRIEAQFRPMPACVQRMCAFGATSFYKAADEANQPHTQYFDLLEGSRYCELSTRPGIIRLNEVKRARGIVRKNPGASLIDLGDGVLCVEFHSKMNSIGEDLINMIHEGIRETSRNYLGMVIGNQGENFSVGANLMLVLLTAQEQEWDDLDAAVRRFQQVNMAIKYAPNPVVAAPFGMALGGGCEVALHAARVQASAELYMGLVEVGVGLIPAGGGCKELLLRLHDPQKAFEQIGWAKTSASAAEARHMGFLRDGDEVSMNPERLIADAKSLVLSLVSNYAPGSPRQDVKVRGESAYSLLKLGVWTAHKGGYISDYDAVIGEKLAHVLSGGRLTGEQTVSEQHLLDLEREAFLSLCGRAETQARIQHMLKTGKPLRN
jgi:3-hydroxyacyl-CoA dehydrogenase